MNKGHCILQDLARHLVDDPDLKGVHLDAQSRKVSFALMPGHDEGNTRQQLKRIVRRHRAGELPEACPEGDGEWQVRCAFCARGTEQELPEGIHLIRCADESVRLEKASCATARKLWHWQDFKWVRFYTRVVPRPVDLRDLDEWKQALAAALLCGVFGLLALILEKTLPQSLFTRTALPAYLLAYLAGAWFPAQEVWELLRKRILDVHFLMLCVAVGAAVIGHWWEGAMLLFLFSFSGALEELAMARTEREVNKLFKDAPKEAAVVGSDGVERKVPVEKLETGMILRIRPDSQFPVDAELISGETQVNEAALTGESLPVDKQVGDPILGGTLNLWGSVDARVLHPSTESAMAKIMQLIREAQDSKAPSQRFTDRFGTGYTWGVLGLSLGMFLFWWQVSGWPAFRSGPEEASAFYRAMTLMVVASPCALVLSIPSAILAGIAAGARSGILFRGGAAIERLAEINRVALDKTGTLTTGELQVDHIEVDGAWTPEEALRAAAALAHHSPHPVSRAISGHARKRALPLSPVENFRSRTGMGVEGQCDDFGELRMGRRLMFPDAPWIQGLDVPGEGATEVLIESARGAARLLLQDSLRPAGPALIQGLKAQHLRVNMLTGDRGPSARAMGQRLGLEGDELRYELHPEDKVEAIQTWTREGDRVAMVGDGVNDAPSLAAAHVSVGMGLRGSDAALEQADIILTSDRLEHFMAALQLSRRARRIIQQNLAISLGAIVLLVVGALGGAIPLTVGVVGHEGSTVIVVLNSLRLLWNGQPSLTPISTSPSVEVSTSAG